MGKGEGWGRGEKERGGEGVDKKSVVFSDVGVRRVGVGGREEGVLGGRKKEKEEKNEKRCEGEERICE